MTVAFRIDSPGAARASLNSYWEYPKVRSWLLLWTAELPTCEGVVVTRGTDGWASVLATFMKSRGWTELLVRSDSTHETGAAPRGGSVLGGRELMATVEGLLRQDRAVFALEPLSPYSDAYSLSLVPDAAWRRWVIEIVGPGFDASDLKRGDVTPHETIEADVQLPAEAVVLRRRVVADDRRQARSWLLRVAKVARQLKCPPAEVHRELQARGEPMLVQPWRYPPIREALVASVVRASYRARGEVAARLLEPGAVVFSMSFVGHQARPVFWDIVVPSEKYRIG